MKYSPPEFATREAGQVSSAILLPFKPKHKNKSRPSFAQRAGLRYEKRVFVHLMLELEKVVSIQPAFRFNSGQRLNQFAIPDALYVSDNQILTLFEVKLHHTADAWYQLRKLYQPILATIYPNHHINVCEICRSYEPRVRISDEIELVESLREFVIKPSDNFGLYLWSGL